MPGNIGSEFVIAEQPAFSALASRDLMKEKGVLGDRLGVSHLSIVFAAAAAGPLSLSDASAASSSLSSSRRRRELSKEVSIPWLLQSRLPANRPVVKHRGSNWLQKPLARVRPLLEG